MLICTDRTSALAFSPKNAGDQGIACVCVAGGVCVCVCVCVGGGVGICVCHFIQTKRGTFV